MSYELWWSSAEDDVLLATYTKQTCLLRCRGLQPPVLRLRVLHLLYARSQQLVLQQSAVRQTICCQGERMCTIPAYAAFTLAIQLNLLLVDFLNMLITIVI